MGEKEKVGKKTEIIKNGDKDEEEGLVSGDEIAEIKRKYPHNPLAVVEAVQDLYDKRVSGGFSLKS